MPDRVCLQSRARCLTDYGTFAWFQAPPLRFKSRKDGKLYPLRVVKAADPSQCVQLRNSKMFSTHFLSASLKNCVAESRAVVMQSLYAPRPRQLESGFSPRHLFRCHYRCSEPASRLLVQHNEPRPLLYDATCRWCVPCDSDSNCYCVADCGTAPPPAARGLHITPAGLVDSIDQQHAPGLAGITLTRDPPAVRLQPPF